MWPSADPGDAGQLRLPGTVESGAQPAQEAVLHLPPVEEAGVMAQMDRHMDDTAICTDPQCGHVRWRHGPYPENPCKVPGCLCEKAWSFIVAAYWGNPHTDGKKHK